MRNFAMLLADGVGGYFVALEISDKPKSSNGKIVDAWENSVIDGG